MYELLRWGALGMTEQKKVTVNPTLAVDSCLYVQHAGISILSSVVPSRLYMKDCITIWLP